MRSMIISFLAGGVTAAGLSFSGAQTSPQRHFTIAAVEPRGGVNVAQEAFPSDPLPQGGGYVIRAPDASGRWEVSTYLWMPAQVIVNQGDRVVLDFVGINGAVHPTEIEGLGKTFTVQRGQVTRVEFNAEQVGVYPIICGAHMPSMRGEIVVNRAAKG